MKTLPHTLWILIDRDNGHEGSRRYLWWFETRQQAIDHRKTQNANPRNARVIGPYRFRADR